MGNELNSTFFCKCWSSSQLFYSSLNYCNFVSRTIHSFFCVLFPWLISLELEGEKLFRSTFFHFLLFLICFNLFSFIPSLGIWTNIHDTFFNKDGRIWLQWLHRANAWRHVVLSHPSCNHVPVRIHVQLSSPLLIWNWLVFFFFCQIKEVIPRKDFS